MQIIVYWRALRSGFREPPANGEEVGIVGGAAQTPKFVEYQDKIPANPGKKDAQCPWLKKYTPNVFDFIKLRPPFAEKDTKTSFCRSHQRMVFTIFVGDDLQPKFRTKNSLGKFAEIPAKIFLTPKNWPALTLMPPTT